MKEHVMKLNYPKTFKRIIVLFILLAVIAWLYKSAVNEKMNKSLWPILGIFFNVFAVIAFCTGRKRRNASLNEGLKKVQPSLMAFFRGCWYAVAIDKKRGALPCIQLK